MSLSPDAEPAPEAPLPPERPPTSPQRYANLQDSFQPPYPWVTYGIAVFCIVIWAFLNLFSELGMAWLEQWGGISYFSLLVGQYWGFLSGNFVHFDFFHILFNLFWVLFLGAVFERQEGRLQYILFVLGAGVISIGTEILWSDQAGIGISGIVFAMVGFVWWRGQSDLDYRYILSPRDYSWIGIWWAGCFVLTYTGVLNIGNGAHTGGLIWGIVWAWMTQARAWHKALGVGALLVLLGICVFWPLRGTPWSSAYRVYQAWDYLETLKQQEHLFKAKDKRSLKQQFQGVTRQFRPLIEPLEGLEDKYKIQDLYYAYAQCAFVAELFSEAVFYGEKALALDPNNLAIAESLASFYSETQQYTQVEALAPRFVQGYPNRTPQMRQALAVGYLKRGQYAQAIEILAPVLQDNKRSTQAIAYYNTACAYSLKGDLTNAFNFFKAAIQRAPEFKADALNDDDLKALRAWPEFQALVSNG